MARRSEEGTGSLLDFFLSAGALKKEPRRGWVIKLGMKEPESVADHSYRTAMMAMVYADAMSLDTAKAVKMALIHDLPEALVGDSMPGEISKGEKLARETSAMKEILARLTPRLRREYLGLWEEFNGGGSKEALLVRQLDKLEMALQAAEYRDSGYGAATGEFLETARRSIGDEHLREMLGAISGKTRLRNRAGRPSGPR